MKPSGGPAKEDQPQDVRITKSGSKAAWGENVPGTEESELFERSQKEKKHVARLNATSHGGRLPHVSCRSEYKHG